MTQVKLDKLLTYWQKRLRLQDWFVTVKIVPQTDLLEGKQATVGFNMEKRAATIKILDPRDYPRDTFSPQDIEQALVHELLHLHLGSFDGALAATELTLEEQVINSIAAALTSREIS